MFRLDTEVVLISVTYLYANATKILFTHITQSDRARFTNYVFFIPYRQNVINILAEYAVIISIKTSRNGAQRTAHNVTAEIQRKIEQSSPR